MKNTMMMSLKAIQPNRSAYSQRATAKKMWTRAMKKAKGMKAKGMKAKGMKTKPQEDPVCSEALEAPNSLTIDSKGRMSFEKVLN
jgi:hypothetical protein